MKHLIFKPVSDELPNNLSELESAYVDLWDEFFVDDLIFEINPLIRPAVVFFIRFCTRTIR